MRGYWVNDNYRVSSLSQGKHYIFLGKENVNPSTILGKFLLWVLSRRGICCGDYGLGESLEAKSTYIYHLKSRRGYNGLGENGLEKGLVLYIVRDLAPPQLGEIQ